MFSATRSALLCLAAAVTVVAGAAPTVPRPADPFADPRHDPYNPLRYIASDVLTAIAFSLIVACAFIQTFWMRKWGAWWMSAMVIGEYAFAIGLGCRFGLHVNPESKGIYIVEYLFVVLSPCAFIAADYVLLGRLARHLNGKKHLLVRPERITVLFISSDVTTFLVLQLLSFATFTCIYLHFLFRLRKHEPAVWARDAGRGWFHDWRTLAGALCVSCVGILIRSVYRTAELSQGFQGHLATTEGFFYGLDTLPLAIAVFIYVPFWPGRFIPPLPKTIGNEEEKDVESAASEPVVSAETPARRV